MPSRKINRSEDGMSSQEVSVSRVFAVSSEVEAELDEGNIHEAESSLREGLSLNFEEARTLLGRLEYQRGNIQAAPRVFDGIDLQAAILHFQPSDSEKPSKKSQSLTVSLKSLNHHASSLVLEAINLKSLSLHKLGNSTVVGPASRRPEAAQECKNVLDAAEKILPQGLSGVLVDNKLQETVSKAVELLPELWKQAGCYSEAILAYRRALLSRWNFDAECCAPSLAAQIDDPFVPKSNLEELMILLRKSYIGKTEWDPEVIEHFTFAVSLCSQTYVLA